MRLFDTMSREVRELIPDDGKTFRFYCCGPTVYGPAHIGNFRTFLLQDVFRRVLELGGTDTFHVRNLTDVDDKTIRDSQAANQGLKEFTDYWTEKFQSDCGALNMLPPHKEPGAVEHIPHQIEMIADLMKKGHAYSSDDGSVYFKVTSFDGYGRLSRLDQRELRQGASKAVADDEYEKDAVADFALWKGRREEDGDNFWESPWGQGRPGWHLECSAMCREYLGDTFDLHSGGVDLIFPHHENEIAQSEACNGTHMADHWFHLTHLLVDGGKMSKSAKNFYTLTDIIEKGFSPAEVRYALISASYRQPLNFVAKDAGGKESFPALTAARQAIEKIAKYEASLRDKLGKESAPSWDELRQWRGEGGFTPAFEALQNDLNTPDALGKIFSALKEQKLDSISEEEALQNWMGLHKAIGGLGIELPEMSAEEVEEAPAEVQELAAKRAEARSKREWEESDRLRDEMAALGWEVKDGKEGFELCRTN